MRNILTVLMVTGIAFTVGLSTARADETAQSRSDIGQKLQLQLHWTGLDCLHDLLAKRRTRCSLIDACL